MLSATDANLCQLLRREIDAALLDRDRTIKEAHELREKLGILIFNQILIVVVFKDNGNDCSVERETQTWRSAGA